MALAQTARKQRLIPNAEPNVIPFIDVLLVLLIIFMVTTPKPTTDLRLDLPRPGPSRAAAIEPTIVDLRADGAGYRLLVGGEEVSLERLSQRTLAHVLSADPILTSEDAYANARVFVRADQDVAYQNVVAVIERLQQARFEKVGIYAQRPDDA
ncbi:MAG: biopolymer transporter ExbD [Hyphomonadaceae bacterium]